MLKRIALTAVIVVTAAFTGVGVARAHAGAAKSPQVTGSVTAQGFGCIPGGGCR